VRLTDDEFRLVKAYPRIAAELLGDIDLPWPVARFILQHHEPMHGSGYPAGLTGDDILPVARIIAVADVVEAMASHRSYRPALGIDAALREVSDRKDDLYDPAVVDACLTLLTEKAFAFSK
jgi:HD-GYP domain-containing protein (c-di-GMP phosphodiesterase class II)